MSNHEDQRPDQEFEAYPLTRQEYISSVSHLYRGELERANTWRIRLDTTTNWAIVSVIGILSFAFGVQEHPSTAIVLGMFLVLIFLHLEARRYRYFDVWKNRVRMIEENFYGPLLRRELESPRESWAQLVAADLLSPHFKCGYFQALRTRLIRNYLFLYVILLAGWLAKAALQPAVAGTGWPERLGNPPVPWWLPVTLAGGLYLALAAVALFAPPIREPERERWSEAGKASELLDF